ncbi:hypothetical protein C8R26_14222, partial [Nitrosomonas oligotropha]
MTITLIAFDGSENAMRAIDEIVDTLDTSKLHVHLLNVCEPVQMNEVVFNDLIRKIVQPSPIFSIIRRILTQTNPSKRNCHG